MNRMCALLCLSVLVVSACSDNDSPTTPTPNPTPTPPTVTLYTVIGTVNSAAGGAITEGEVRVVDGPSAGRKSGRDGSGRYRLENLAFAGFSISVNAPGYVGQSRGISLTSGQQTFTSNFTLLPAALWTQSGRGNQVFNMPSYVTRIRVVGVPRSNCENFAVWVSGRLIVNVILGRCSVADAPTYDGTHLVTPGVVETRIATGIDWTISEVR